VLWNIFPTSEPHIYMIVCVCVCPYLFCFGYTLIVNEQGDTKKGNFWNPQQKLKKSNKKNLLTEIERLQLAFLRDSNPNYQCLKIMSCRWSPPLRMHSFNLPLKFSIARCNISAGIPRISSWILCFNSSSKLLQRFTSNTSHVITLENSYHFK